MYTLYGTNQTGTCAIQAALAEAGILFKFVEISTRDGQHLTESYRRINPRQQVPALRLPDGVIITEGPAILLHLADAHPESQLAPTPGSSKRSLMNRWLIYFCVNVYEGELRKLFGERYTTDSSGAKGVQAAAVDYVNRHYKIFEEFIDDKPFVFGEQLTVLDIYVWMLAQWMDGPRLSRNCPKISALAEQVKSRPHITPIHQANFG